jgi:hypothetical protein
MWVIHSFIYSLIYSLINSFIHSLVRSFTYSITYSFVHSFISAPDGQTSPQRLQFSTPMFSPAPREKREKKSIHVPRDGPVETPSTQDLYSALSLQADDTDNVNEYVESYSLRRSA